MNDMMTAIEFKDGNDTNGRFQVPYKKYSKGEIINFYGHNFSVIDSNNVILIVEEVLL